MPVADVHDSEAPLDGSPTQAIVDVRVVINVKGIVEDNEICRQGWIERDKCKRNQRSDNER